MPQTGSRSVEGWGDEDMMTGYRLRTTGYTRAATGGRPYKTAGSGLQRAATRAAPTTHQAAA
jgi:hypothetical protein